MKGYVMFLFHNFKSGEHQTSASKRQKTLEFVVK